MELITREKGYAVFSFEGHEYIAIYQGTFVFPKDEKEIDYAAEIDEVLSLIDSRSPGLWNSKGYLAIGYEDADYHTVLSENHYERRLSELYADIVLQVVKYGGLTEREREIVCNNIVTNLSAMRVKNTSAYGLKEVFELT